MSLDRLDHRARLHRAPRLVTVAHGTRDPLGNLVARAITSRAARRLGVAHTTSYVELCSPTLPTVMGGLDASSVVVPLLLSTGYHLRHDIPSAVDQSRYDAAVSRPLGPHPLLAEVMCLRLRYAGARVGDPVVLAAAGSTDPDALVDLAAAGRMLAALWGAPVRVATISGCGPSVPSVVAAAIDELGPRIAVAPYLLAPGFFHRRLVGLATEAGAGLVADVIGAHPLVAELVARRYRAQAGLRTAA